jgi:putative membrane protein
MNWFASEWKAIVRSRQTVITLIGIMLIPAMYSGIYLWAFWDPYGHVERLSVAVVNEDVPVVYEGETYAIGNDLSSEFQKDRSFNWHFVSRKEADDGLNRADYYFGIYIPPDFSRDATTLTGSGPTPLKITLKSNEAQSYIVAKIGQAGVEKIRKQLSEKLTLNYTKALFGRLNDLKIGLDKAADGASKLNLGIVELSTGTKKLRDAAAGGRSSIVQLQEGASALSQAGAQLANGTKSLDSAFSELSKGSQDFDQGFAAAANGSAKLATAFSPIAEGANGIDAALKDFALRHPDLQDDPAIKQEVGINDKIRTGITEINTAVASLNAGLAELKSKHLQLTAGLGTFGSSLNQVSSGASRFSDGAQSLSVGVGKLVKGWDDLLAGIDKLVLGENQLLSGSGELSTSLRKGADELGRIHSSQALFDMMANPVRIVEQPLTKLPNYGTGMAPFFVSISLYVGAMLLSTVFPLRAPLTGPAPSGWLLFLAKYSLMALVSLGQTLIASYVLISWVGLRPFSNVVYFLYMFFLSLVFMAIILLFIILLDNMGRFVVLILFVLQLAATSGTFPVELGPQALQTLHRFLPITYSVQGFRMLLTLKDYSELWRNSVIMAGYLLVSVALTIVICTIVVKRNRDKASA